MADLKKEQLDLAVDMYNYALKLTDHVPSALRHAAPYLQLPWDNPSEAEVDELTGLVLQRSMGTRDMVRYVLYQWAYRRYAALIPKPTDPRVALVSRMLRDSALDCAPDECAAKIIAAIDALPKGD